MAPAINSLGRLDESRAAANYRVPENQLSSNEKPIKQQCVHVGVPIIFYNEFSLANIKLNLYTFLLNQIISR